jgi:hypothetical protein
MRQWAELKQNLQNDIWNTYESGIQLEDGCVAFYDQINEHFVDGASLKPLDSDLADQASSAFAAMTPQQQLHNRSYLTFCAIYSDLENGTRGEISPAFNRAMQPARSNTVEHVSRVVERVLSSLFAPRI